MTGRAPIASPVAQIVAPTGNAVRRGGWPATGAWRAGLPAGRGAPYVEGSDCRSGFASMPERTLDPVEWELVRADIAMEKARLRANGDWSEWEAHQAQTNARIAAHAASIEKLRRAAERGHRVSEDERIAWWWALRTRDLSFLSSPPRRR